MNPVRFPWGPYGSTDGPIYPHAMRAMRRNPPGWWARPRRYEDLIAGLLLGGDWALLEVRVRVRGMRPLWAADDADLTDDEFDD